MYATQFDRYVERHDESALSKMQQQYWEAKQTFLRKIRKKEDDCVVASDAELDSKLEVFNNFVSYLNKFYNYTKIT